MANISATTTLDTIIKDIEHLSDRSFGDQGYFRLLSLASRAIMDINQFFASRVVTRKQYNLSELNNGVLPYPDDCVGVIGIFYNEGNTLFPVTHRRDLIYLEESGSVSDVKQIDDNEYLNFATTGARNKYYVYDDVDNRRLIFDTVDDEKIWLKYVSTGVDAELGEDTIVPVIYREVIENYVIWKDLLFRGKAELARYYKREWEFAGKRLKAFQSPSFEELKDAVYSSIAQAPLR